MAADILIDFLFESKRLQNGRNNCMTNKSGQEMEYAEKNVVLFCSLVLNVSIDVVSLYLIQ